ncbi:hypothetical protein VTJ49DRAFT_4424 [Mycothermus thermophilus]|uniref:Laccase n=1 Tax=Humicola insolens TaxID=85995 RepID=A0ABR3V5C9_HUMIN
MVQKDTRSAEGLVYIPSYLSHRHVVFLALIPWDLAVLCIYLNSTVSNVLYTANATLSQQRTNGIALWGTLLCPSLPFFLSNNPLPDGFPWGRRTDWGNNQYRDCPRTGVTRHYDFTISRGYIAPDGYQRDVLLVNGQFPGPLIEANWGDTITVNVKNDIKDPEEGTSIHWHGFLQRDTSWEDGAPGVTQCPIPPKKSYRYEFVADLYGTTWYHAHYSAQYTAGIVGPIVVHGPTSQKYDIDLGPIMLSDWYHKEYFSIVKAILTPNVDPRPFVVSDNNLINGKMHFDCSTVEPGDTTPCTPNAGISKFRFQPGKTHRLRLINSGADGVQRFSIDEHTMTVIAEDLVPVKPYNTTVVTLGVGQRTDVLVKADHPLGLDSGNKGKGKGKGKGIGKGKGKSGSPDAAFWIRSNLTSCSPARQPNAVAAVYYDGADTDATPQSTAWDVPDPGMCANDDLSTSEPLYKIPLPPPSFTHTMGIELFQNASNITLWKFNGVSMRAHFNKPVLLEANAGRLDFDEEWNVVNYGSNSSVRIVIDNQTPTAHPMHLHGHNMYILHEGPGAWDGTSIVRPSNPTRRDVYQVREFGHLVIQFDPQPGVWAWHCHIAWHAAGGFFASLLVQPDSVRRFRIPKDVSDNCRAWDKYTRHNVVDQIDSGA